jgi:hypothetical protein
MESTASAIRRLAVILVVISLRCLAAAFNADTRPSAGRERNVSAGGGAQSVAGIRPESNALSMRADSRSSMWAVVPVVCYRTILPKASTSTASITRLRCWPSAARRRSAVVCNLGCSSRPRRNWPCRERTARHA